MVKKNKLTFSLLSIAISSTLLISAKNSYAVNLKETYQQALKQDKTYQAEKFTYDSAKTGIPIARAGFLPSLTLAATTTSNKTTPGQNSFQNSQSATFTLTESLSWATFEAYAQAKYTVLLAELAYKTAYENLITNPTATPNSGIVNQYFQVINDIDNLTSAKANLDVSTKNRDFVKSQYKVGLVAKTDLDSAIQRYASAISTLVGAKNKIQTDINTLSVSTNHHYKYQDFARLKPNFKLSKPNPANINTWANMAETNNLSVLSALAQVSSDKKQIGIDNSGYFPNLSLTGSYTKNKAGATTNTTTASATANWNIGAFATLNSADGTTNTFYQKKQDTFKLKSDQEILKNAQRQARVNAQTSYLNVISDIKQIEANRQAVISGEAALNAAIAQYQAGTGNLINVLQVQANWYSSYQKLSSSIQSYFNDRIALKQSVGQLSEKDIDEINNLLVQDWKPSMSDTSNPTKEALVDNTPKIKTKATSNPTMPKQKTSSNITQPTTLVENTAHSSPNKLPNKSPNKTPNQSLNNSSGNITHGGLHFHTHYH